LCYFILPGYEIPQTDVWRQNNEEDHFDDRDAGSCHAAFGAGSEQARSSEGSTDLVPSVLPLNSQRKTKEIRHEKDYFDDRDAGSCHAAFRAGSEQARPSEGSTDLVPSVLPLASP
jgi:hypothetical protein